MQSWLAGKGPNADSMKVVIRSWLAGIALAPIGELIVVWDMRGLPPRAVNPGLLRAVRDESEGYLKQRAAPFIPSDCHLYRSHQLYCSSSY